MSGNETILGLVGSPNTDGLTNQLVTAALKGAADAGATTELIQMSEHVVDACRDCLPWVCLKNLKCSHGDENFAMLCDKILNCGGLVLGTPVYWLDTSAMVKYLILKMFRIYAMSGQLRGLPALGVGIAGGTGNGMVAGLRPVYHFFQVMQMRALEPVPATRFDLAQATERAEELGHELGGMRKERQPFASWEECLLWYDNIPYISGNRADERRLLASITSEAVPEEKKADIDGNLARADILAASGRPVDSMKEISKVVNSSSKIIGR